MSADKDIVERATDGAVTADWPAKLLLRDCVAEIVRLRGEVEHWKTRARVNLSELDDLRARAEAKDVEVQSGCPACKLEAALAKQGS